MNTPQNLDWNEYSIPAQNRLILEISTKADSDQKLQYEILRLDLSGNPIGGWNSHDQPRVLEIPGPNTSGFRQTFEEPPTTYPYRIRLSFQYRVRGTPTYIAYIYPNNIDARPTEAFWRCDDSGNGLPDKDYNDLEVRLGLR